MSFEDATQYEKVSIKNRPYQFFNNMINIKTFDPSQLEINKLSGKKCNINIYHIEHITMKSLGHVNIDSENPLYLIFNNEYGYIIEVMEVNN